MTFAPVTTQTTQPSQSSVRFEDRYNKRLYNKRRFINRLGLGRALGETMAVTFLIGNAFNISPSLFTSGVTITSALANEFAEASSELHLASLLHLGLILFVITFIVLSISKLMLMRIDQKAGN